MNANSGGTCINAASIGLRFPDAANPKPTLGIKSVRMLFMLIRFPSSPATRLESCLRKIRVRSYCITFRLSVRSTPRSVSDPDRRHQVPSARYQNCCKAVLRARAHAITSVVRHRLPGADGDAASEHLFEFLGTPERSPSRGSESPSRPDARDEIQSLRLLSRVSALTPFAA